MNELKDQTAVVLGVDVGTFSYGLNDIVTVIDELEQRAYMPVIPQMMVDLLNGGLRQNERDRLMRRAQNAIKAADLIKEWQALHQRGHRHVR